MTKQKVTVEWFPQRKEELVVFHQSDCPRKDCWVAMFALDKALLFRI